MDVVPRDDIAIDVESLATKYPIVDWKIHVLIENMMYYQIIKADGSSKNYKIFSKMLDDFDRQDVLDLHRLVQERVSTSEVEECFEESSQKDLKYGDHTIVSNEIIESVIATWLIRSYKEQFEDYMEIKKQKETRGNDEDVITDDELSNPGDGNLIEETKIDVDVLTNDIRGFNTYDEYKDAWIYEWNKDVPWKKKKYCNGGDLSGLIRIGDEIYFESYEWYENLEDGKAKQGWFDEHELMRDDDDDIRDLEDYLIRNDHPYYVNEEEERSKERICKLL
ncbi:hypothetical protein Tco_0738168 [Tanacetum coccineum]